MCRRAHRNQPDGPCCEQVLWRVGMRAKQQRRQGASIAPLVCHAYWQNRQIVAVCSSVTAGKKGAPRCIVAHTGINTLRCCSRHAASWREGIAAAECTSRHLREAPRTRASILRCTTSRFGRRPCTQTSQLKLLCNEPCTVAT